MKVFIVCCLLFVFPFTRDTTVQEKHPFEDEIVAFEQADKEAFPPKNAILFTGSSSIRLWKDLAGRFPNKKVINRGFGGSGLEDLLYYASRIVYPYKPRQIVIYSGENDIAAGKTPAQVLADFKTLFTAIRQKLPNTPVAYIAMKPSPSRAGKLAQVKEGNLLISSFLKTQKKATYIDVFNKMLGEDGQPRPELFLPDNLHMNEQGYNIWTQTIKPYLR
jgi:lysophospholipase L1-like esterase